MRIASIQVGQPQSLGYQGAADPLDQPWTSAIVKQPVAGRIFLAFGGLAGDAQADQVHHGGPDQALLAYAESHYPVWRRELERTDLAPGWFGENLTVTGLDERRVCVGDVFAAGDCLLEVSQPRVPCQNLARRFRQEDMVRRVQESGRSGWYLRVLVEGWLERGQDLRLEDRPYPQWPIAVAARVMAARRAEPEPAARLGACPALSAGWRKRIAGVEPSA